MNAKELIRKLQLQPHPEGGFYRETFRSANTVDINGKQKSAGTAIYYLLEGDNKSHFHRITSDELWFFHYGQTLEILVLSDGKLETILLGNAIENGELLQAVIPANTWFSAGVKNSEGYALVSCTVSPGFEFSDFQLANRKELIEEYPDFRDVIEKFTF